MQLSWLVSARAQSYTATVPPSTGSKRHAFSIAESPNQAVLPRHAANTTFTQQTYTSDGGAASTRRMHRGYRPCGFQVSDYPTNPALRELPSRKSNQMTCMLGSKF